MARLEDITVGCSVTGISGSNTVEIVAVKWFGTAAMEVTYKNSSGQAGNQLLFRDQEESIEIVGDALPWSFTADTDLMRLCSEAYRIKLDSDSRLCVELFTQYAFNTVKFGDADVLARAKGTSVAKLAGQDILYAAKGDVRLLTREELPEKIKTGEQNIWLLTQQLTHAMETGGIQKCAEIIAPMFGNNAEEAKNLAYRLYSICERKNWAQEAYAYNALVVAWPEIQSKAAELQAIEPVQIGLFE